MTINKILILGASGMLGHTLFSSFSSRKDMDVYATARSTDGLSRWFGQDLLPRIIPGIDAGQFRSVETALNRLKPDVVINCIGIIKQLPESRDPLVAIEINALFPHKVAQICKKIGARMIHISTDCVFSGKKGNYCETDFADADDLYGRTKYLGEVSYPHCITLRTSVIGHELKGKVSLIDWFLAQEGTVRGFTGALYTGFPTVEMARIIADYVIPLPKLNGLYHVSADPISKHDLLGLVAAQYGKKITIERHDDFHCDRSLNSSRFRTAVGYTPPAWPELVAALHNSHLAFTKRKEHEYETV
jgi:dTDP-4-dehydrorhamnose reductase